MPLQSAWSTFVPDTSGKLYSWLPVVVFGLLAALFHLPYLQWFPQGIHEWAQSDRLALAYGFYDHGFNFMLPRSLSLAPIDGVVGVELPVQSYTAALLGLVFGRGNISPAFRLIDAVMLTVGCCYLYKLVFETTRNAGLALLPGAFVLSSPIFAYYSGNYLPDPFGVSVLFVAFYYLHRFFYRGRRFADFSLGLALATLATLIKLAIVIYLGSLCFVIFVVSYLQPTLFTLRQKLLFVLMLLGSFSFVGAWIAYMRYLNEKYVSWLFLATVRPLRDKSESDWVLSLIERYVKNDFFSFTAYHAVQAGLILLIGYALWRWRRLPNFAAYAAVLLLAATIIVPYYVLMGPQFAVHDYYLIVPLMPLVVLIMLGATLSLQAVLGNRLWSQLLGVGLAALLLINGYQHFNRRMQESLTGTYRYRWMTGGSKWLDRVGVPTTANILVLGRDDAPNLALTHFERAGLVSGDSANRLDPTAVLKTMTGRRLQYVVVRTSMLRQIEAQNPQFLAPFKTLSVDPKYVLLAPRTPLQGW